MKKKLISIGLPIYNAEIHIERNINSLLKQSYKNIEIIISNNASTDATHKICKKFMKKDKRIRYFLQKKNMGFTYNYQYVLMRSKGAFFMWTCASDLLSRNFIMINKNFLDANTDFVASSCPSFVASQMKKKLRNPGDSCLKDGRPETRIIKFLTGWHKNRRFYSLFRSQHLKNNLIDYSIMKYPGSDWLLIVKLLKKWKFNLCKQGYIQTDDGGCSTTSDIFSENPKKLIYSFFPFFSLSKDIMQELKLSSFGVKSVVFMKLMMLNALAVLIRLKWKVTAERKNPADWY